MIRCLANLPTFPPSNPPTCGLARLFLLQTLSTRNFGSSAFAWSIIIDSNNYKIYILIHVKILPI